MKKLLILFGGWKLFLLALVLLATQLIPLSTKFAINQSFRSHYPYLLWIWANFDGYHYLSISRYGYGLFQHPFMPFYPILIHFGSLIFDTAPLITAVLVSNISFFAAMVVLKKLALLDKVSNLALFFAIILLFPTSFFYGAVYNDSLFLLLASLCLLLTRKKHLMIASMCGFIATLTRINGLALFPFIIFEFISQPYSIKQTWKKSLYINYLKNFRPQKIKDKNIYFVLLIPAAFLLYLLYTQLVFGNWQLVFTSMHAWNQDRIIFPLQVFWRYFKILILYPSYTKPYLVAIIELSLVFFYIFIGIYTVKKIRFSYWVFLWLSFLIPSLTGTFQGMPRYALHIYPLFLGITIFLQSKNLGIKMIYFLISILLLFFCLAFFTRGYFIS